MTMRRAPGPLLVSIAVHVVVAYAILHAAFHYDFSRDHAVLPSAPTQEHVSYVAGKSVV